MCVCVYMKEREEQKYLIVSPCTHSCFLMSTSCTVCVTVCTLHHTAESILHGVSACVSLCKLSSWSPLWESLAVRLILLSRTPVSVPHLSAQPQGPSCSPCTPGFTSFFSLTSRLCWLAAPIETELDNQKRRVIEQDINRMGRRRQMREGQEERMRSVCPPQLIILQSRTILSLYVLPWTKS